jgi:hypothetical protein
VDDAVDVVAVTVGDHDLGDVRERQRRRGDGAGQLLARP